MRFRGIRYVQFSGQEKTLMGKIYFTDFSKTEKFYIYFMEDLLQEEDFKGIGNYNPWKYFWISAAIILGGLIVLLFLIGAISVFMIPNPILIGALVLIMPLVIVPLLIFRKKELLLSTVLNVSLGTFLLLNTFYIPLMIVSVFGGNPLVNSIFVVLLITLIPLLIIMLIFKKKQKRMRYKESTYQQY